MGQQLYVHGYDKGITWQLDGGSVIPFCIVGWDLDDTGDLIEVTSTCTGGGQAFLAGIQRTGVDFQANFDINNIPTKGGTGIRFGAKGTISCQTGASPWAVHVSIASVKWKSTVNGVVSYGLTAKGDALMADGTTVAIVQGYPG